MAYGSRGRRPIERASKSAHHHVINDESVVQLVRESWLPQRRDDVALPPGVIVPTLVDDLPVQHFIAIDGSYQEAVVRPEYPSSTLCFMQFGAVAFTRDDLLAVETTPHPAPEDMHRLRNLERLKLALPLKNMRLLDAQTLTDSIRQAVYRFFNCSVMSGSSLMETLRWFVFREFQNRPTSERAWHLASSPCTPEGEGVDLRLSEMRDDYTFLCGRTNKPIYLTDVFRLHERIDEELGAGGILSYLTTTIEQIIIAHILRLIARRRPAALSTIAIVKDGPLAFFGVTANLHRPMRELLVHLRRSAEPNLIGVEKSGPFVEHAHEIADRMQAGQALILNDDYIYRCILASGASDETGRSYGASTYYGRKVIFKTRTGAVHVLTVPTTEETADPQIRHFMGFRIGLQVADLLHCDMYDDALFPVALANKLVSLSAHPSQRILERRNSLYRIGLLIRRSSSVTE
jgi:hypothetical protein